MSTQPGPQKRVPTANKQGASPLNNPNSNQPLVIGRNKMLSSTQPILTLKSMKRGGEPLQAGQRDGKVNY